MKLRISINARKIEGPYGGGNQFAKALEKYLQRKGHETFRRLVPNLDLILIVSSQKNPQTTAYDINAIADYISLDPDTVVVQRVNTCDDQRGSNLEINEAILKANQVAYYTVFVSSFVRDLFARKGLDTEKPNHVILNGADEEIFNPSGRAEWSLEQKLRIVTHHWSSNYMKGFDIYERLDQLLEIEPFKNLFEFTFIGNIPIGVSFKNTKVIPPTWGVELANFLRQHHIYLTAARNEPGPNHCVEGIRSGLPILYLKSGALPEYCASYGIEFTLINFEEKLLEMHKRYKEFREKVLGCPYTGSWMAAQYEELFLKLVAERKQNSPPKPGLLKKLEIYFAAKPYRKFRKFQEMSKKALKYLR